VRVEQALLDDLARVAHECWRARMTAEGWRPGPVVDPFLRTHDALVCYDRLSPADRRQARLLVETDEIAVHLAALIDYPRGPSRPFTLEEMRVGRPVRLCGRPEETGTIECWDVDASGDLEIVGVRWSDGTLASYATQEQVLERPEECQTSWE
jgi:hypothetical protein